MRLNLFKRCGTTLIVLFLMSNLLSQSQGESARSMGDKLQLFQERSIFSRERLQPVRLDLRVLAALMSARQVPVFTGVLHAENEYLAFLEDPLTGVVSTVRIGQVLPQGSIENITLDDLTIRTSQGAEPRHIQLGQTLRGETRQIVELGPQGAGPAATAPTTAPAVLVIPGAAGGVTVLVVPGGTGAGGVALPTGLVDMSDLIERMKARRRAEIQGK